MTDFRNLQIDIEDRIALVTIRRPQVLNALDGETIGELKAVFQGELSDSGVGAVILTGAGEKAFVSGTDISELVDLDPLGARTKSGLGQDVLEMIEKFPKVVIAAINGYCLGGGCELALACHMRVAAREAWIGFPEVKLGIIPGYGGTQRLPRAVGKGKAMELVLSGESVSGQEAERIGLVNRVVELEELIPECQALAAKILANGPLAVRYSIEAINNGLEMPLYEATRLERTLFALACATEDTREGIRAFLEKRAPQFRGK